ncbi:DtxR family iron (metal) dependent repressor [Arcticibacter tournemirensis]|uniref:Transcriptional regulator MntR n=1 Tax=Arcticibacter tournemirensis TaxID=699437 RepID=A0A4V1KHZ3_9SPHI|nr:metal-dependent transcriptional regulator [Arcticibacter tournemirensis]KAA8484138.1 metal-dependent transcriptional regulator [Arcticibacter tournemirensis]RXF68892.1 metal-dependent transcriptional regulator [Arcticibacter tournemirensis]TQM51883.1 DtxR family iron (metal) dependent repressor [Arcticibacter tournemirensis]
MLSYTEENYLKALLHLTLEVQHKNEAGTNQLAFYLGVKPATATDMLRKLKEKKLISYEKYGKISLSEEGRKKAVEVVRKHRLWETFLYEKLEFSWDEVHEVAEQLEHIQSPKLVEKLDKFLGHPEYDPHGDAIPDAKGYLKPSFKKTLAEADAGTNCRMVAVKDNSASFLQYVSQLNLAIDAKIQVVSLQPYDGSMEIIINNETRTTVSQKFAENILIV